MSTNNDGWIDKSTRRPSVADFPVWLHERGATDGIETWLEIDHDWANIELATHWKPAAADIPAPPREKTQAEKDEAALDRWMQTPESFCLNQRAAWHAALAYERAEVGKMLPPPGYHWTKAITIVEAIRARCGGGK